MSEVKSTVEYRDIKGFPGYRVGNDGSVWSLWRAVGHGNRRGFRYVVGHHWNRLAPKRINKWGHLGVSLHPGIHYRLVHRLVLEAFTGPCPRGMEARHFPDRNPANNNLGNLSWATHTINLSDRLVHGTMTHGERGASKLTESQVQSIRSEYIFGVVGFIRLSRRYGVSEGAIRHIINRDTWKHLS